MLSTAGAIASVAPCTGACSCYTLIHCRASCSRVPPDVFSQAAVQARGRVELTRCVVRRRCPETPHPHLPSQNMCAISHVLQARAMHRSRWRTALCLFHPNSPAVYIMFLFPSVPKPGHYRDYHGALDDARIWTCIRLAWLIHLRRILNLQQLPLRIPHCPEQASLQTVAGAGRCVHECHRRTESGIDTGGDSGTGAQHCTVHSNTHPVAQLVGCLRCMQEVGDGRKRQPDLGWRRCWWLICRGSHQHGAAQDCECTGGQVWPWCLTSSPMRDAEQPLKGRVQPHSCIAACLQGASPNTKLCQQSHATQAPTNLPRVCLHH